MKKKLAIILALAMVISLLPAMALTTNAAETNYRLATPAEAETAVTAGTDMIIVGTADDTSYVALTLGTSVSGTAITTTGSVAAGTLSATLDNANLVVNASADAEGGYNLTCTATVKKVSYGASGTGLTINGTNDAWTVSAADSTKLGSLSPVFGTLGYEVWFTNTTSETRAMGCDGATLKNYALSNSSAAQRSFVYVLIPSTGAATPTPTPAADTANANVIANVTVAEITHTVTYGTAANGTFTVTDGTNVITSGSAVVEGTTIYVNASPAAGFQVESIMVNGTPISGTSFTLTADAAITVTFSLIPASNFTVAWNDGTGYTVTVMDGETPVNNGGSVEDGTEIAITISLDPNYELVSITDGTDALVGEAGVYNYTVTANVTFVITVTEIIEQPYAYVIPASIDFGTLDLSKTTATASYDVKLTTLGTNAHVYVAINKTSGNLVSGTYQIPYTITGNFTFAAAETKQGSASLNIADVLALNLPAGSYNFSDAVIFTVTAD